MYYIIYVGRKQEYMLEYKEINLNPKGKKTADCVIRAISGATGIDYYKVYEDLYQISVKTGYMLNEKRCEEKLLEKYNFKKYKQPRKCDGSKYQINELDKLIDCKKEKVVVSCAHHLTCIKNNKIEDIWDCGSKSVGNYYILEEK